MVELEGRHLIGVLRHMLNARLTCETQSQDWSLAPQVTNLRNTFCWYHFAAPGGQNTTGSPGEPRMWNVARRNFH